MLDVEPRDLLEGGAATVPPQIEACGSSTMTMITSRGFVAGTMPDERRDVP